MDALFSGLLNKYTPVANPYVMNGLATVYMPLAEQYIDSVFKSVASGFPKGLEYVGYERCTQLEEFNEATRHKQNKRSFDLARSDLYLVKYHFRYKGEALPPRYIYLPFVNDGGIIHIGGSMFHIAPVLSDKVISPGNNSVFVRLLRDKINFDRCLHSMIIDGYRETTQVIWSPIYRKTKNATPPTTKANTCLVHYLLAQYGFDGMFNQFAGFVPVIGEDEINEVKYPKEQWVICQTANLKPKTFMGDFYEATRIRLAVPRDKWTPFIQSLVAGFFYTVDHFPARIQVGYVNNQKRWMVLLGHIIFSGLYGEGRLYDWICEHFNSLDEYIDNIVVVQLKELGYDVTNFYDLLALIIRNFNDWTLGAPENAMSMYGKTLEILYNTLYDITSSIFKTNFRLNKSASTKEKAAGGSKELTAKEINEIMNKQLKPGAIFKLRFSHVGVSSVSYSGDNKYPKITSILDPQQAGAGMNRGRKTRVVVDASKRAHISMAEAGSLLFLSKSNPTPAARVNMFVNLDMKTGVIVPKPKFDTLRQETEAMMRGQFPEKLCR